MNIEELFPPQYAKSNVDKILSSISYAHFKRPSSPLSIIAPAGYGKTHILRYIAYNRKYRRRYSRLRKIEFIYININEVLIEKVGGANGFIWAPDYAPQTVALEKILYRKVINKYQELCKLIKQYPPIPDSWSKDILIGAIEDLVSKFPDKNFYFIFDDVDKLFQFETISISNLIKYIRDRYRGSIECIFSINTTRWFEEAKAESHGEIVNYLTQRTVVLGLMDIKETELYIDNPLMNLYARYFLHNLPSYKTKSKRIQELSGGYLPYKKYLINSITDINRIGMNPALANISEKLIVSLTSKQKDILFDFIAGVKVNNSWDLNFLQETGIIKRYKSQNILFSPIFKKYLEIRNRS
ncbi:hypothetical protein KC678_02535 [Candidatus Dojkabacteria bacterium]|uniref:Uncharacterized protein n=1 Tax=Candidatus Dojkabacteria bacterium TaxID=2099670 RepID=A0A955IA58_9BACT|nr:hypothetical protein [Candidatus Dojkabacteria bacterium]